MNLYKGIKYITEKYQDIDISAIKDISTDNGLNSTLHDYLIVFISFAALALLYWLVIKYPKIMLPIVVLLMLLMSWLLI